MGKIITGYKGFTRNWKCRGFQYEVGKTYEIDGKPKLCERGFHFCTSPLAVFKYYDPTNRFALVEADEDDVVCDPDYNKAVTRRITIVKELTLREIIDRHQLYTMAKEPLVESGHTCYSGCRDVTTENSAMIGVGTYSIVGSDAYSDYYVCNNGDGSAAVVAGTDKAGAESKGVGSVAVVTGFVSAARSCGVSSLSVATSNCSVAISSKTCSAAVVTHNYSIATGSNGATAMCTGIQSQAIANTYNSLAVAAGEGCAASGVLGSWLVLVERNIEQIFDIRVVRVDGKDIKEGVRYELVDGKIHEVL